VDFSGHWQLNEADSDDPQRLVMSQLSGDHGAGTTPGTQDPGTQGGQGGRGGRGGRAGGGRSTTGALPTGPTTPPLPVVAALGEALRWPGKELDIKQVAGVVAMTSSGASRVYQPSDAARPQHAHSKAPDSGPPDREMHPRVRGEGPPPVCGWEYKTLVVEAGEADDDHPPFTERFSVSEDGQRLVEVVGFKGGRGGGFTLSRVWDRAPTPGS
jgi:hypothetical protein